MDDAALVAWVLTAGGGLTMAAIWLARGGLKQRDEVLELSYGHVPKPRTSGGSQRPRAGAGCRCG